MGLRCGIQVAVVDEDGAEVRPVKAGKPEPADLALDSCAQTAATGGSSVAWTVVYLVVSLSAARAIGG
jgi:hypothetical protein